MSQDANVTDAICLLGEVASILDVRDQIKKAAKIHIPVLITGESGTGKEIAARMLHALSAHSTCPFLQISCPAILPDLFEGKLFGDEEEAMDGSVAAPSGKLGLPNSGTLFLDDVGELDCRLQAELLQVIQDPRLTHMGESEQRQGGVRLVCATNRDLEAQVARGAFRADLFYRMNVLRIEMPPLRDRASDVPLLLDYFLKLHSKHFQVESPHISPSMLRILESYHWPGNVRELENLAKRFIILGGEGHILSALDHRAWASGPGVIPLDLMTPLRIQSKRAVQTLERRTILSVLQAHQWNRKKTARSLDISYRALLYKMKDAGFPSLRNESNDALPTPRSSSSGGTIAVKPHSRKLKVHAKSAGFGPLLAS